LIISALAPDLADHVIRLLTLRLLPTVLEVNLAQADLKRI
jgi:hypothetical protein